MKTMKFNKIISVCLFLSSMFVTACSQDDDIIVTKGQSEIRFLITDTGVQSSASTRAVTDAEYRTTFENGKDKVSLFAVKDNKVIEGFSNICLTYQDGTWAASTAITYTEALEGATFYAVYPYNDTPVLPSSIEENQDVFKNLVEQWSIGTNQAGEEYTKYDLMTGSGTASKDGRNYTVNLQLEHRMAMIAVEFPYLTYNFTNPDLDSYSIPSSGATFNLIQGESTTSITPYYDETTNKYRLLVKPNNEYTLTGEFTFRGELYTYSFQNETGAEEKKYTPHTVKIKLDESEQAVSNIIINDFTLAIGDYYCADGSLINATDIQEGQKPKVIGVIYNIGTTEAIKTDKPNCSHGLVYALQRAERPVIENDDTEYSDNYVCAWGAYKASFANLTPSYADFLQSEIDVIRGYEDTKYYLTAKVNQDFSEKDYSITKYLVPCIDEYEQQVPPSASSTGWYIPSYKELSIISQNQEILNQALQSVNGEETFKDVDTGTEKKTESKKYWTSTLRGATSVYLFDGVNSDKDNLTGYIQTKSSRNKFNYFRFALAF